jgi:SAM-dependent methyltransferase
MESGISPKVLRSEQQFFDREAADLDDAELVIPPYEVDRYRFARRRARNIPKETLFSYLMPLEGKRVLDYGCGHGENACLLAACGAQVTAFDLSPMSIQRARERAAAMGVADRIRFDVLPAGDTRYPSASFDIITGFAILHHLHMDLRRVYEEIDRLLTSTGTAYFVEPAANSFLLRKIRGLVPVPCDATPDERQLEYRDFEHLKRHGFARVDYVHFYCTERLHRIFGDWARRPFRWVDYHMQRLLPAVRSCYGTVLVIAHR